MGIPEIFLLESGILGFGIRNTVRGIRIALTTRIRNPSSTDKESAGIQCQVSGIQNPRLSRVPLYVAKTRIHS